MGWPIVQFMVEVVRDKFLRLTDYPRGLVEALLIETFVFKDLHFDIRLAKLINSWSCTYYPRRVLEDVL